MSAVPEGRQARFEAGSELREARERLGWDLGEVAAALRIKLAYLQAIEDGRLAALPGNAYALGFLRTYATTLGLDADAIARRFRAEAQDVNRKPVLSFPAPVPERGVPTGAMVLLGVVLAVVAYVGWYRWTDRQHVVAHVIPPVPAQLLGNRHAQPLSPQIASVMPAPGAAVPGPATTAAPAATVRTPSAAPTAPAATTPSGSPAATASASPATAPTAPSPPASPATTAAAPAAASSAPGVAPTPAASAPPVPASGLALLATGVAWAQVRDADGRVIWDHVMQPGESWPVPAGRAGLTLTTGNAGGIEIVSDGKASPVLGRVGAVRRGIALMPPDAGPATGTAAPPTAPQAAGAAAPAATAAPAAPPAPRPHRHATAVPMQAPPATSADDLNARELRSGGVVPH